MKRAVKISIFLAVLAIAMTGCKKDPKEPKDVKISIAAIVGVSPPVADGAPVTAITATEQYTGTVVWTPAAATAFAHSTEYTATITLKPRKGYTLAGVAANFFTVAGTSAPATNAAGSGVITAVFPATGVAADTKISIAAIVGVTPPVAGETPATEITETEQYTGAVAWEPDDTEFEYGTAYTATITLTPKTGYTLAGVAANFFTVAGTSAPATNAAGSGVIMAVFPATADAIINIPEIDGITAPVAGETPATGVTETEQFTGTVAWTPADAVFEKKVYTAIITLTAKAGYTLEGVPANFFIVDGANTVTNAANSGVVTAVFPAPDELPYLPEFTLHPTNRTIAEGQDAPFTVTVTPGNPAETVYQWQMFFGGSWKILSDITDEISGANTRLLLLKSVSAELNGAKLRCAVSNTAGEVISGEATLTVNPAIALTLSASLLEFPSAGGTLSVNVITTTDWSAGTLFPAWLLGCITPTSGTGNGKITITLPANTGMMARSTTVTVSGTGAVSKSFTIWQAGASLVAILNVSPSSITIEGDGTSFYSKTFTVTTGVSWTASSSATWLTVSPASGTGNGTVTVTATPNPSSTASRTAVITVGGDNTSPKTVSVTQEWYPMVIVPTPDGSASYPFIVNSAATLQKVGSGTDGWTPDKHYRQTANITLSGLFTPINNFNGTYDGGGYFIDNLIISSSANSQGMFSRILNGGVVRNVALTGAYVGFRNDTWTVIGGIAGNNGGTIENCYVTGGIWGWNDVGGIAGFNAGVIQNCYTNCSVTANGNDDGYDLENNFTGAGGIVGRNALGTVRYCYATGRISCHTTYNGGIVGYSNGDIDRCVAMNYEFSVWNWGFICLGRIRGNRTSGTLTNCYARANGMRAIDTYGSGRVYNTWPNFPFYIWGDRYCADGDDAAAIVTHGAYSGMWWYDIGFSNTNWNCANNRLPHLKTTGGGAFSHTQTPKVQ